MLTGTPGFLLSFSKLVLIHLLENCLPHKDNSLFFVFQIFFYFHFWYHNWRWHKLEFQPLFFQFIFRIPLCWLNNLSCSSRNWHSLFFVFPPPAFCQAWVKKFWASCSCFPLVDRGCLISHYPHLSQWVCFHSASVNPCSSSLSHSSFSSRLGSFLFWCCSWSSS